MNDRGHLSFEELDALQSEGLGPSLRVEAEQHLQNCAYCKQKWQKLQAEYQQFEQEVFSSTLVQIRERVGENEKTVRLRPWTRRLAVGFATVVAVIAVIVLLPWRSEQPNGDVRNKGGANIQVFAKRNDRVFAVDSGVKLQPGDQIRFVVDPAGSRFLLIAGLDSHGTVTIYHPLNGDNSAEVGPGRIELPGSIRLNDTPGTEWLFFVFSDVSIHAASLVESIKAMDKDTTTITGLVGVTQVETLSLEKEMP